MADPPVSGDLPSEAMLTFVVYEPDAPILDDAAPPVANADVCAEFVDDARVQALSANRSFQEQARERALAVPVPERASPMTLIVTVDLGDGVVQDISFDDEDPLRELTGIYAVAGWAGVAAVVAAVQEQVARRTPQPRPGGTPDPPDAVQRSEGQRWNELATRVFRSQESLAVSICDSLDLIEHLVLAEALLRVGRARDFGAACRQRYGIQRGRGTSYHALPTPIMVWSYLMTVPTERKGLYDDLMPLVKAHSDEESARWRLMTVHQDTSLEDVEALIVRHQEATQRLGRAITASRASQHPLCLALFYVMAPSWDEDDLARVAGRFVDIVITEMEKYAAAPPPSLAARVFATSTWRTVVATGPERALVQAMGALRDTRSPLAIPELLAHAGSALRARGDAMSSVVATHLQLELAQAHEDQEFRELLVSGGLTVLGLAVNVAAVAYPPARTLTGIVDSALTAYNSVDSVRAALALDGARSTALTGAAAAAADTDLPRLGRAIAEFQAPSGVIAALLSEGLPVASLVAADRGILKAAHWLDAADVILAVVAS